MKNLYSALLLVASFVSASAQNAGQYYFKAKTGIALESMASGATSLIGTDADNVVSTSQPFFPFTFAGQAYDHFSVSEDGVVILGAAQYSPYNYDNYFAQLPIFSGSPVYPVLLPWGEDLSTGTNGGVTYKVTGTAPSRKLVIQFQVNSVEDLVDGYNKTFQVWLFEGSNNVQFVYGAGFADWYNSGNIGIAASASDYASVDVASQAASAVGIASNDGAYPGSGTSYVFSAVPVAETPATPLTASLSLSPEYPVAGQQWHTVYLGYGVQSVALNASVSGGSLNGAYTYSWSPATGLSSTTAASPVASPVVTTTYTVTVKDASGNTLTKAITVYVNDPRYGDKFKVCKLGKTTICISKSAVDAQLSTGATLGACETTTAGGVNATVPSGMTMLDGTISTEPAVYPNPATGAVTVKLPESMQSSVIKLFGANGNLVLQKNVQAGQRTIGLDLSKQARGLYLVKVEGKGTAWTSSLIVK